MRMKEVCERTGLTDRAVRLYIDSGLVEPKRESSYTGRSAIYFDESDIEKLQTVAVLRKAGFSIADIKIMQASPKEIPMLINAHRATLEEEISQKQSVLKTLSSFSDTYFESCSALAAAIDRSSPELSIPKEDFYMSFEGFKKILRSRLISILAFAALLIGAICFLILGIKTAFTEVCVGAGGGHGLDFEVVFNGIKTVFTLAPAILAVLSVCFMIPRLAGGRRVWLNVSLILCLLSTVSMLFLPEDISSRMFLHEYIAYRYSFMHSILPGRGEVMDFFIAFLKFIPNLTGAIFIIVGLLRKKTFSEH